MLMRQQCISDYYCICKLCSFLRISCVRNSYMQLVELVGKMEAESSIKPRERCKKLNKWFYFMNKFWVEYKVF